ncbi:peptidoglycan DD-metalloendopeptidase family protein [Ramlibacter solisilvae]|uniref:M23 family metallopeptidase n=1 Tax=Ramlibacter tataouinensis TaxID=94132 RepID=UPI000A716D0A|nr:M23 family metallopeptidase [Ramlibacter tataouinensis]
MKTGLTAAAEKLLQRTAHTFQHHPRQVTALLATLMFGAGGAAFAVASLDPGADSVIVRQVLEDVVPLPLEAQLQQLDLHDLNLFRSELTRERDTAEALLARLGVNDPAAAAFLRKDPVFRAQLLGRAGRTVTVEAGVQQELQKLTARWAPNDDGTFKRLVIKRSADSFSSQVETAPLTASTRLGSGTVRSSLFAAADEARMPDGVVNQMVDIFSGDINFRRDLRVGDYFNVVYEALEADGEPMRTGRILSAEFVNAGKPYNAVWFQAPGRKGAYYTPEGNSLESSYLSSPVEFSRVSSGFAMRMHPIQRQWKQHLGVDLAAVTGTPVRTVGDGTIEFAGVQNGFGKVVIVKHNNADRTLYAHLSKIGVHAGQSVSQGQNIGAVGSTGWATGPHLHFEFLVNGVNRDPMAMAKRSAPPLTATARADFDRLARAMRVQLAAAGQSSVMASAE